MVVDRDGNVIIAGDNTGSDFVLGDDHYSNARSFVLKLNPAGGVIWFRGYDGYADMISNVGVDDAGNVVVAGQFQRGAIEFPGARLESTAPWTGYLWKLSTDGEHRWATTFDASTVGDMVVLANGTIVVGGAFTAPVVWGKQTLKPANNDQNAFVLAAASDGKPLWATHLGDGKPGEVMSLAVGLEGEIWSLRRTPSGNRKAFLGEGEDWDGIHAYLDHVSANGTVANRSWKGPPASAGQLLAAGQRDGGVVILGSSEGALWNGVSSKGLSDCYVIRLGRDGTEKWRRVVGTPHRDFGAALAVTDASLFVAVERNYNSDEEHEAASGATLGPLLQKISLDGRTATELSLATGVFAKVTAMATIADHTLLIGGTFNGRFTVGGTTLDTTNNDHNYDAFVVRQRIGGR